MSVELNAARFESSLPIPIIKAVRRAQIKARVPDSPGNQELSRLGRVRSIQAVQR